MNNSRDQLYLHEQPHSEFVFDDKVAAVFQDMINRSVPGYATIISMIGTLAERYVQPGSNIYDLGCSLGAASLAMRHHLGERDCRIIAVDNSESMITRCRKVMDEDSGKVPVELICDDLFNVEVTGASMVVLNFTLQFIPLEQRLSLLQRIHDGLVPGGLLVLSEKIRFADSDLDELFIELHHQFKRSQGYSEMEVSRKRAALENVLLPETIPTHEARFRDAGFASFDVWFQCFNFTSMVAIKGA